MRGAAVSGFAVSGAAAAVEEPVAQVAPVADAALPGAEALLAADVLALLAPAVAGAGGRLLAARPSQVRYHAGRSLAVRYAAEVAWADGAQRTETLGALVQATPLPEGLAVVRRDDGAQVGVWRYPHDPFLPGLPHAAYPDGARALLAALGAHVDAVAVEPLVYRPGSRAVLRLDAGDLRLYVKVVRPADAAHLVALHDLLAPQVRVPRCLGASVPLGVVALEPLGGVPLTRPLVEGGALPDPAALLAPLEALAGVALPAGTPAAVPVLDSHARLLRTALPTAADEIADLVGRALDVAQPPDRTVHGDYYEAQVLVDGDGAVTGVLDVDGVRAGAAHDDPATLLAHLVALAHVHPQAAGRIDGYRRAVTEALRVDRDALHAAVLGQLLGLATTSFRRQEPGWPARTRAWLDRCRTWAVHGA